MKIDPQARCLHCTHHSAPYMGRAMDSRQNIIYTFFFSQIYLTIILIYMDLGYPVLFVKALKTPIVTFANSSTKCDKPFYKYKVLHPEWYAQLPWPIFKSKKKGSELAKQGPVVNEDALKPEFETGPLRIRK